MKSVPASTSFGLTAGELIEVVKRAVAAKASFVLNFPLNAAGQLSYIYGTGALRDMLRLKGWEIDRTGNIEATYNPKTGIKIVFQNADSACEDARDPKAISDKGPAATGRSISGRRTCSPSLTRKTSSVSRARTPRSGISASISTATMSARNSHSRRASRKSSSRASTSEFTSSSRASGRA